MIERFLKEQLIRIETLMLRYFFHGLEIIIKIFELNFDFKKLREQLVK